MASDKNYRHKFYLEQQNALNRQAEETQHGVPIRSEVMRLAMDRPKAERPDFAALLKICKILNVFPEYFLGGAQNAQPSTNAVCSHRELQPPLELALERIEDDGTRAKMRSLLEELQKRDEA